MKRVSPRYGQPKLRIADRDPFRLPVRFKASADGPLDIRGDGFGPIPSRFIAVANPKRGIASIVQPANMRPESFKEEISRIERMGILSIEPERFLRPDIPSAQEAPASSAVFEFDYLVRHCGIRYARQREGGKGITIAIVDSGINGERPEFATSRRFPGWTANAQSSEWVDKHGHGTMCAAIASAAGSGADQLVGVAPECTVASCKVSDDGVNFFEVSVITALDYLAEAASKGLKIIANCSFGWSSATYSAELEAAFADAVDAGVLVVASAGNNHRTVGGESSKCTPPSIWGFKGHPNILTVGACHVVPVYSVTDYSSRGPGTHQGGPVLSKPDCVGPVLENGDVLFGDDVKPVSLWGTSAAAAFLSGVAALVWSAYPKECNSDIIKRVLDLCKDIGWARECQGAGIPIFGAGKP